MQTPTQPVVIVSDDPAFSTTLQHQLEEEGRAATVQRPDESTAETLAAQQPGLVVIHPDPESTSAAVLADHVQQAPAIDDVPVIACADNRAIRQNMVNQLRQHRGTVVASSSQTDEVYAKLHDLDMSSPQ